MRTADRLWLVLTLASTAFLVLVLVLLLSRLNWGRSLNLPDMTPTPGTVAAGPRPVAEPGQPAPPVAAASSAAAVPVPVWDLCGIGRLPMPVAAANREDLRELPPHLGANAVADARARLLAALRRGDARAQAAALVLAGPAQGGSAADRPETQALAAAAMAGRDPTLLRWAIARCGIDSCGLDLIGRWQQLEPDNAAPHLLRHGRGDESLRAVWAARRFRSHFGELAEILRQAMPADVPPYVQQMLLLEAVGTDRALLDGSYRDALELCRPAPPEGSERRTQCSTLGRLMMEQGDTVLGLTTGLSLRERATPNNAELPVLRKATERLLAQRKAQASVAQPLSCEAVNQTRRWVEAVGRDGEVAALRASADAAAPR